MTQPVAQSAPQDAPPQEVSGVALAELAAIYRGLDEHLAGLGVECRACGLCCDFARNDYRLYASFLERAAVLRKHGPPQLAPSGQCGFLRDGQCSIRPWRPLGCRVFFCAPGYKAAEPEVHQAFQQRLRAATDRHGLPWDYRPFFAEPLPGGPTGQNSTLP